MPGNPSGNKGKWGSGDWPSHWYGQGPTPRQATSAIRTPRIKSVSIPAREIEVLGETDVVVVGGGPAGVGAALAAARQGADTVLIERYGHLGGLAAGGLVICIMPMSDGSSTQQIAGITQEIIDSLDTRSAVIHPRKEEIGSSDPEIVAKWKDYLFFVVDGRVRMSAIVDPEMLACTLNDMMEEAGVHLLLHSWNSEALVESGEVKGVVFESKSGRQALLGKIVIDTTGDGDVLASAGAEYDATIHADNRSSKLSLCFLLSNVDIRRVKAFEETEKQRHEELMRKLAARGGFTMYLRTWRDDTVWFNNYLSGLSGLNVENLAWVEIHARKTMLMTHRFFRKHIPGFEKSYLSKTASQVGVRCTRRLIGEHVITEQDVRSGIPFADTIAVCPPFQGHVSEENPLRTIPYRALLPRRIENLLAAGRCLSADVFANNQFSPIQFCIAMGQAAGTAAALSARKNLSPRQIDRVELQESLRAQGVPLPPSLQGRG